MIEPESEGSAQASLYVDVQNVLTNESHRDAVPSADDFSAWSNVAYGVVAPLLDLPCENEFTLRIVEEAEISQLNDDFRGKAKSTNVLSFPFEVPTGLDMALLGDVVICHQVVVSEAEAQSKTVRQHYAHMLTHGILHLCGYDHEEEAEAEKMEALEVQILALSAFPNPYLI